MYIMPAPPPREMTRGPPRFVAHPPGPSPEALVLRANIVKQVEYYFRWVSSLILCMN